MKKCSKCGVEKEIELFYANNSTGRYNAACKACEYIGKRKYKEANRERLNALAVERNHADPEKAKQAQIRYREKNPGLAAKRTAEYRKNNPERVKEAQRLSDKKLKDAAYAAYGGYECRCCGEKIVQFLSIDHINNDGNEHRKVVDRRKIYKWLAKNNYPEGFQILCMNCNFGKARNNGVCPHKSLEGSTTIPKGSTPK